MVCVGWCVWDGVCGMMCVGWCVWNGVGVCVRVELKKSKQERDKEFASNCLGVPSTCKRERKSNREWERDCTSFCACRCLRVNERKSGLEKESNWIRVSMVVWKRVRESVFVFCVLCLKESVWNVCVGERKRERKKIAQKSIRQNWIHSIWDVEATHVRSLTLKIKMKFSCLLKLENRLFYFST